MGERMTEKNVQDLEFWLAQPRGWSDIQKARVLAELRRERARADSLAEGILAYRTFHREIRRAFPEYCRSRENTAPLALWEREFGAEVDG